MNILKYFIIFLFCIPILGNSWRESLNTERVKTYFDQKGTVLSICIDKENKEVKEAHDAYLKALSKISNIKKVVLTETLEGISGLSVAEIMNKGKSLPVDFISILKIDNKHAKKPSLSVSLYNKEGLLISGFLVKKGEVLKVSKKEVQKIKKRKVAQHLYSQKYLTFKGVSLSKLSLNTEFEIDSLIMGERQKNIGWRHFYLLVNRRDLAERYQLKVTIAQVFWTFSAISFFIAPQFLLEHPPYSNYEIVMAKSKGDEEKMIKANDDYRFKQMDRVVLVAVIGIINGIIGILFYQDRQPVSDTEIKKLVLNYNKDLRKDLNIPNSMLEKQSGSLKPSYNLTPFIGENSGGLSLGIRF